jgi:hypothetical protein
MIFPSVVEIKNQSAIMPQEEMSAKKYCATSPIPHALQKNRDFFGDLSLILPLPYGVLTFRVSNSACHSRESGNPLMP